MSKQDNVIKLLLIEDSVEEAEQLISMLRNGGIAVRPARAANAAELETQVAKHTPDLILANLAARTLKLAEVAATANRTGKDIAIIAVATNVNEDTIVGAFQDGARALALRHRAEHVQAVVRREFESLNMRRSVRRLETSLRETERRCDALLDSSRDPIAYVHEGMHVRANKAYLEIFGFEDFEEIQGMSILDMIAPDDADDFKSLLRRLSKGEKPPQKLNLKAQRGDGTTFDATMEFAEASYEGEPCQQIIFRQQTVSVELDVRPRSRLSATTPMTSASMPPCPFQSATRLPVASSFGNNSSARRALIRTRRGGSGWPFSAQTGLSRSLKPLPRSSGSPMDWR